MQSTNSFPSNMQEIIIEAEELIVFQIIDPNPLWSSIVKDHSLEQYLSGYAIIHSVKIDSLTERQQLTEAIAKGIEQGDEISRCFFPNHALTAKRGAQTLELLICFKCDWIQATLNGEHFNFPTTNFSEAIFDIYLPEYAIRREAKNRIHEISSAVNSYSYPITQKIESDLNRINECEFWLEENPQILGVKHMHAELQRLRGVLEERAKKS